MIGTRWVWRTVDNLVLAHLKRWAISDNIHPIHPIHPIHLVHLIPVSPLGSIGSHVDESDERVMRECESV
jgi:hypothetical protein